MKGIRVGIAVSVYGAVIVWSSQFGRAVRLRFMFIMFSGVG